MAPGESCACLRHKSAPTTSETPKRAGSVAHCSGTTTRTQQKPQSCAPFNRIRRVSKASQASRAWLRSPETPDRPSESSSFEAAGSIFAGDFHVRTRGDPVRRGHKIKYPTLAAGKPPKVGIVAVMRRLLALANALLHAGRKWAPNTAWSIMDVLVTPTLDDRIRNIMPTTDR